MRMSGCGECVMMSVSGSERRSWDQGGKKLGTALVAEAPRPNLDPLQLQPLPVDSSINSHSRHSEEPSDTQR